MSGKSTTASGRNLVSRALRGLLPCGLVLLSACGGPWGPFPGGALDGEEHPRPAYGFEAAEEVETVAVEVGGESPRSVQTWVLVLDGELYVPADFFNPGKRWPHQAIAEPRARMRIEDRIYRGRLTRIEDPTTIEALRRATALKYDVAEDSWAARIEVWWFRFDPPEDTAR